MKQTAKQYLGKAARHFLKLAILIGLLFAAMYFTGTLAITPADLVGWRGGVLLVALVGISVLWPFYGFMERRISGSLKSDRNIIVEAMARGGYVLQSEGPEELLFRAEAPLKRLTAMGDDGVWVRNIEGSVESFEIGGLRKAVADAEFRIAALRRAQSE